MKKMRRVKKDSGQISTEAGFTLLELLVVLGIIALFAAVAGPRILKYLSRAKSETAQVQINNIASALELYRLDTSRYPTQSVGLEALVSTQEGVRGWSGPYLKKKKGLIDPWGHTYHYRFPGQHGEFDVYSNGRDDRKGGDGEDKDIVSW